jgi:hypothetical protein
MDLFEEWGARECTSPIIDPFGNSIADDFELKVKELEGLLSSQGFIGLDLVDFTEDAENVQTARSFVGQLYPQPKFKLKPKREAMIFKPFESLCSVEQVVPLLRALCK